MLLNLLCKNFTHPLLGYVVIRIRDIAPLEQGVSDPFSIDILLRMKIKLLNG